LAEGVEPSVSASTSTTHRSWYRYMLLLRKESECTAMRALANWMVEYSAMN